MDRVLVPLDGSSRSEAALKKAFEMFPNARIHALSVIQIKSIPDDGIEAAAERAARESDEILETAAEIAAENDREIESEAVEGNAAKTIVAYAEENDIEHIVMGSTGRSGFRRLLLGSVAESVVRRAPCSVTITRGN